MPCPRPVYVGVLLQPQKGKLELSERFVLYPALAMPDDPLIVCITVLTAALSEETHTVQCSALAFPKHIRLL